MELKVGDLIKVLDCEYARKRNVVGKLAKVVCIDDHDIGARTVACDSLEFWLYAHEYIRVHRTVKFCK